MRFMGIPAIMLGVILFLGCTATNNDGKTYVQIIEEGKAALNLTEQKLEEGSYAIEDGRYEEARKAFIEAKSQATIARDRFKEVCSLPEQADSLACPDFLSKMDDCLIPTTNLLIDMTHTLETVSSECEASGCSDKIKSDCLDLLFKASDIDVKCDSDAGYSQSIERLCNAIIP